jgi:hypothetical protein
MKLPLFLWFLSMFTSIFGYRPRSGSETLELRIRIRQKLRILADPDPQHCIILCTFTFKQLKSIQADERVTSAWTVSSVADPDDF